MHERYARGTRVLVCATRSLTFKVCCKTSMVEMAIYLHNIYTVRRINNYTALTECAPLPYRLNDYRNKLLSFDLLSQCNVNVLYHYHVYP